jgi:hypothetical protein
MLITCGIPRAMQIGGDVATRGFEIAQYRHSLANCFEIIDRERYPPARDREEVQDRVGRSPIAITTAIAFSNA